MAQSFNQLNDLAFPRFVEMTIASQSIPAWVEQHQTQLEAELDRHGAVLIRGLPVSGPKAFDEFVAAFDYPPFTYQESLSNAVRINATERVFTANEAPPEVEIFLHHEMAQTPLSPSTLFFFCQSPAEHGGATPVCRSDLLFAALKKQRPELAEEFAQKGVKYTTHMPAEDDHGSGQGRGWRSTLSVNNRNAAETKLKDLGYRWQWQNDGSLRAISPELAAVKTLPDGKQSFYNQLIAAYMGWRGVKANPSSTLSFGDGSPILAEHLTDIVCLAEQFTVDLNWQAGDIALIDNHRVMHGRRPYSGERKRQVWVALA